MATLRRIASLDGEPCPTLNRGYRVHRLTRHSSLPDLLLGQSEVSIKADRLVPRNNCCKRGLPRSISYSNTRTLSHSFKLSLCRALSSNWSDEVSWFEVPPANDRGRFSLHPSMFAAYDSRGFQKSAALIEAKLSAAGKKSIVDVEKSIVYDELRKSLWKFEPPPRFLKASHVEGGVADAGINAQRHIHGVQDEAASAHRQDIRLDCARNDVKGRSLSLQMLKRKSSKVSTPFKPGFSRQLNQNCPPQVRNASMADAGDSVSTAFTSLFYIMEMLQQYAHSLCTRSHPPTISETAYQSSQANLEARRAACTETLESFLWLFQQVFSCTPRLLLLTIVLLADFTLHSMSLHVAFPVMALAESPILSHSPSRKRRSVEAAADAVTYQGYNPRSDKACKLLIMPSTTVEDRSSHVVDEGERRSGHVDVKKWHGSLKSEDWRVRQLREVTESRDWKKPSREVSSSHGKMELDRPNIKRMLFTPMRAPIVEADDYPCFDQTDIAYQREISADPTNPLLLTNYAQFLHLVRHDHNRAEELYKKAIRLEPDVDGELMGKFASFLWVAKGDVTEADRAFKAAAMADPSNAFHAGNYAHFLWNLSAQSEETPTNCFNDSANIPP